uniref:Uncharacterized protein n=1 Tax=Hemiselmis andersenii TaxID=464988 RepID=A0A7S0THI7_HEMAN
MARKMGRKRPLDEDAPQGGGAFKRTLRREKEDFAWTVLPQTAGAELDKREMDLRKRKREIGEEEDNDDCFRDHGEMGVLRKAMRPLEGQDEDLGGDREDSRTVRMHLGETREEEMRRLCEEHQAGDMLALLWMRSLEGLCSHPISRGHVYPGGTVLG